MSSLRANPTKVKRIYKPKQASKKQLSTEEILSSSATSSSNNNNGRVNMWPPWPFNLLSASNRRRQRRRSRGATDGSSNDDDDGNDDDYEPSSKNNQGGDGKRVYASTGLLFLAYLTQQARIGFRQTQELASQLWFHTPPFFPPLFLIAIIPRSVQVPPATTTAITTVPTTAEAILQQQPSISRIIPLVSNPFVRNMCLWGIFISLMSWSHSELHRKRSLVPLPLREPYRDINKAMLPPFLPEQVPELDFVVGVVESQQASGDNPTGDPQHDDDNNNNNNQASMEATITITPTNHDPTMTTTGSTTTAITTTSNSASSSSSSNVMGVVVEDDEYSDDIPKSMNFSVSSVSPRLRHHLRQTLNQMMITSPTNTFSLRTSMREWQMSRQVRQLERDKLKRMAIYDELVALQKFKKQQAKLSSSAASAAAAAKNNYNNNINDKSKSKKQRQPYNVRSLSNFSNNTDNKVTSELSSSSSLSSPPLGYALVTGSSRGIGRAIAVELARWEIPLILVARDRARLMQLAHDLQACYGVKCCVLPADLSQPNAAQRIWETTRNAGLRVDVLINNAGFSIHGLYVDTPLKETNRMMQVNAVSVAELNQLYGRDMKEQGRGRIMVVSSVNGAVAAGPTVALYSATKAFEKSLALAMAKELEPHGVGVTCLIPGAVRGTDFKAQSKTDEALCWKIPFYPLSPSKVAHQAVLGLLDGDVEVTPGWMNRAFLKVARPMLPQRLHNMVVEVAWNPLHFSWPTFYRRRKTVVTSAATLAGGAQKELVGYDYLASNPHEEARQSRFVPMGFHHVSPPPQLLEMEDRKNNSNDIVQPEDDAEQDNETQAEQEGPLSSSPTEEAPPESFHGDSQPPANVSSTTWPLNEDAEDDVVSTSNKEANNRLMMMD